MTQDINLENKAVSPFGEMQFTALKKPVKNTKKDGSTVMVYTQRLEIDQSTPEGAAFRRELEEINEDLIVQYDKKGKLKTKSADHFQFQAKTQQAPLVMDTKGNILSADQIPLFDARTDKGIAKIILVKSPQYKTVFLHTVVLDMESLQIEPKTEYTDEEKAEFVKKAREAEAKALLGG